jgi:hypothetical protein
MDCRVGGRHCRGVLFSGKDSPWTSSYIFFVPAILVASALGGWGPGILATILGLLGGVYFVAEFRPVLPGDIVNAFVFAAVGVGASWRGELLRRSRLDAAASAEAALAREAHVKSILDTIPDAMIVMTRARSIVQRSSGAPLRLQFRGSSGQKRQDTDAVAISGKAWWLSRPLFAHRRAQNNRRWPHRRRRAQGSFDISP